MDLAMHNVNKQKGAEKAPFCVSVQMLRRNHDVDSTIL